MTNSKIYSRNYRVRKAYWTAFVVMVSYVKLTFFGKIFGKKYVEKRMVSLHIKNANRIKVAILKLEGLFIKVGQLLSILSNFLPEAFQEPLEALQDQIPPRPYPEIEKRIVLELGKKPEELFQTFDKNPLASASIGQVHRAVLHDGTQVAVKIQHSNIEKVAEIDLKVMQRLTNLIARYFNIKGIEHAYTQVKKMIEEELDFEKEAASMIQIGENLQVEQGVAIPKIHEEFSTRRVLTTTFHEGVKISNVEQIAKWNLDRKNIAERLMHAYCHMVFEDGLYHADPHPGNILIQEDGTIVLLDFGAVASLKPEMRTGFLKLIEGAAKNDTYQIVDALKVLGFIADDRNSEKMAQKVISAFRHFLQNEVEFEGLNFKDIKVNPLDTSIFNLVSEIGLTGIANTVQVPKDYVLLNRMVTLLLGISNTLDSHTNPLEVVRPYFQKFLLGESGNMVEFITDLLRSTVTDLFSLPGDFRKVLVKADRGDLEIQIAGTKERTQLMYLLGQQLIFVILMIAAGTFGYLFYQNQKPQLANYSFGATAFFAFLFFRAVRKGNQLRKEWL